MRPVVRSGIPPLTLTIVQEKAMLLFKKTWTLEDDYKSGDKIDIYHDGIGRMHVERHVSPEEREQIQKKRRLKALREEMEMLEKEVA